MAGPSIAYRTSKGRMYASTIEAFLDSKAGEKAKRRVSLILTSPPFPLNRKKKYGNLSGSDYVVWLSGMAPRFRQLLSKKGSVVIEMGNAWEPGEPVMTTLALEALLEFARAGDFKLCQQFICYNPARLPGPAQWVTVERIRVKDSYTHVWWLSHTTRPKASNRRVLKPYSASMKELLRTRSYNPGRRPSEHNIGKDSFLARHKGAIPGNVLTIANTGSRDPYIDFCRKRGIEIHPARMPLRLAEFFINLLTTRGDLVVDPFAGSNVTGAAAEKLGRRWIAVEPSKQYVRGSVGRFKRVK